MTNKSLNIYRKQFLHIVPSILKNRFYIASHQKMLLILTQALAGVAQFVGTSSHKPKGHRFNSQSWHTPRLWVSPQSGPCGMQSVDVSLSHRYFSPSLSLTFPLSLISISMFLGEDKK